MSSHHARVQAWWARLSIDFMYALQSNYLGLSFYPSIKLKAERTSRLSSRIESSIEEGRISTSFRERP